MHRTTVASRFVGPLLATVVLAGCSGAEVALESTTSTVASAAASSVPASTTPPTTTEPPPETTTTMPAFAELADFVPPTEALSSFDFRLWMVDTEDGPDGLVSVGVYVAPDAVSCNAGNPAFVSPSIGVGTAVGSDFWFDDGLASGDPSERSAEVAVEWLSTCPGAAEFWADPFFLDDRFAAEFAGDGGEVEGRRTVVFDLTSTTPDVVLTEARVWLTEDGWPVKAEVRGSMLGGVLALAWPENVDPDDSGDAMVPFEIELDITGPDGAQIVRTPDPSITVGPLNEPVVSVSLSTPSGALSEALAGASDSFCMEFDSLPMVVASEDLDSFEVSRITQRGDFAGATMVSPGMAGGGFENQVVSSATGDLATAHAEVLFNHRAPVLALADWLGWVPPAMDSGDGPYLTLTGPGEPEDAPLIAGWDGFTITWADGSTEERSFWLYLAYPDQELTLEPATAGEVDALLAEWRAEATDATSGLLRNDLQAAANLEYLYRHRDEARSQACAHLATAWARSDSVMTTGQEDPTEALAAEVSAQHLMLALEYLDLLGGYLDDPDIDWLRAEGIDLELGLTLTAEDNPGLVINFWASLLQEALALSEQGS